jgi:hypothetical protein
MSSGDAHLESQGKIIYVDLKSNFVTIDKGPNDGIREGLKFRIVRPLENGSKVLGTAVFEKFMGQRTMAKLVILSGDAAEMRPNDVAIYPRN